MLIMLIVAAFAAPQGVKAAAGSPKICAPSSTCTVGEFLYDDEYTPINTATCTLTSRYPSGILLHNGQSMTVSGDGDGWYAYEFTAPADTGYYRAQVCCTVSGEDMCIDKSFEISVGGGGATASEVADAVWGYSNRTLSGFGSLVGDIWGNSDRTLSSFGTLTRDIWLNASRTLTGEQGEALEDLNTDGVDLSEIERVVKENRLLLEELVHEPIIQNFIEEEPVPDVGEKLKETESVVSALYINQQYVTSKTGSVVSNWSGYSEDEALDTIMELNSVLGEETDGASGESIFAQINWLKSSWGWDQVDDIYDQTLAVKKSIDWSQKTLATQGKSQAVYKEMANAIRYLDTLEILLGDSSNTATNRTLYGKIQETEDLANILDKRQEEVGSLITGLAKGEDVESTEDEATSLFKRILAVNKIPNANIVINKSYNDLEIAKVVKNRLLGMYALIDSNKKLLALGVGEALANTWVEEGSMVFKSLVTNPSTLIEQEVPLKYYLPPEVREEDVISVEDGLTLGYDAEADKYFVEGTFTLKPGETKTLSVKVDDIWVITDGEVESLRKQAEELAKPLNGTSYYAQGVTLTSDINVHLDKIVTLQETAVTPEQQIRAYREAAIELEGVNEKMSKLQDLVTQAGSAGTLFGFVGGAQAIAVWGLIIIMATGFVFLAIYMKQIQSKGKKDKSEKDEPFKDEDKKDDKAEGQGQVPGLPRLVLPTIIAVAIISSAISGLVVRQVTVASLTNVQEVADIQEPEVMGDEDEDEENGKGGEEIVRVTVENYRIVNVRTSPDSEGEVIAQFKVTQEVTKVEEFDEWVLIAFESENSLDLTLEGWVRKVDVEEPVLEEDEDLEEIEIVDTPSGELKVKE